MMENVINIQRETPEASIAIRKAFVNQFLVPWEQFQVEQKVWLEEMKQRGFLFN